ncbi:MAG: DNA polymerase III subunit alpha [Oscillospiraceae bacterium]
MSFAHLHTHTAYSLLDGEGTIKKIVDRAKELGQTAMAITDHGNMYGVIEFYEYAKSQGIKPILGCEVYVAARGRYDKVHEYDSISSHLILLAKNNVGYKNLMNIVSLGFTQGFYYKPRIDMEVLRENSEGIIALSACMFGVLSRNILGNNYEEAKRKATEFVDIFGRDNYFIEIQDHGIYEQKRLNRELIAISKELDLKLVATNDIHYVMKKDAEYQDVLMCIQMCKNVDDEDRMKMSTDELYVKSEDEMRELFGYVPEAIENTQKVADMCEVEIEFGKLHLPEFSLPEGVNAFEYLKNLCINGMEKRYPNADDAIKNRLKYELETIKSMGYVDYFLIVWDFIRYAREKKIMVGPGRGSAAGSVVSYCLYITNVDPIKYGLIFERFLNPERVSMPDIDIDFCYERRGEVIEYVNRKYGEDRVCQIITFGTMAAKQAIRDVGRALNIPYGVVDNVAKLIPFEIHISLEKAMIVNYKLKELYDSDPQIQKLIDTAKELEGLPRHASTHAAGVVITKNPVYEYVPIQKNDDVITTQFTMTTIERLGLLKMDFLGLRTLTVIRDAVQNIMRIHGVTINIEDIDLTDAETFKMISRGDTDGVFQLESPGMKKFMNDLKPTSIEDIIAGISLYRPGPMDSIPLYIKNKNDVSGIKYKHPMLEHILDVTYGCIVYQEQVMQIVRELGGFSLGRADLVRRAMSKKKADVMAEERKNFIYGIEDSNPPVDGAIKRGIDENIAISIFDEMMDFASYAFNKSHAAAYAMVAYQTAWLKCHYKVEFFSALLTSFIESMPRVTKYVNIAKKLGIRVLPPDVNKSGRTFTVDGDSIRFGLAGVKNVGGAFVDELSTERLNGGKFTSFTDFCNRMAAQKINKRVVENLIKCGAFDSFKQKRSVLMNVFESVVDDALNRQKNIMPGQIDLFGNFSTLDNDGDNFKDIPEYSDNELLIMEKEVIGIYVSGHPLDKYKEVLLDSATFGIGEIQENEGGKINSLSKINVSGMITKIKRQTTKRGDIMMYVELEDLTGSIEVLVFPSQVRKFGDLLRVEKVVSVMGTLDISEDKPTKLIAEDMKELIARKKLNNARLYLRINSFETEKIDKVKELLRNLNGDTEVFLRYEDLKQTLKAPPSMYINEDGENLNKLIELLGENNVKLVQK